jgi:hypothetical protein
MAPVIQVSLAQCMPPGACSVAEQPAAGRRMAPRDGMSGRTRHALGKRPAPLRPPALLNEYETVQMRTVTAGCQSVN